MYPLLLPLTTSPQVLSGVTLPRPRGVARVVADTVREGIPVFVLMFEASSTYVLVGAGSHNPKAGWHTLGAQ